MATRETRRQRGKRTGEQIVRRLVTELRDERQVCGLSQRAVADQIGSSQAEISRLEQLQFSTVPLVRLAEIGAILGLELSATFHRRGQAVRDSGQEAIARRFLSHVNVAYRRQREVLLPDQGDLRSWDILLRLGSQLVGVEIETRIRDMQALVRKIRERERDGGADHVVLVLSDTAHNRQQVKQLREMLGDRFATLPRLILAALKSGQALPGSGVLVL